MPGLYSIGSFDNAGLMSHPGHDRLEAIRRLARRIPGGMEAGRWLHRLIDPELRSIYRTRREHAGELYQVSPFTAENRYPELFDALAARLAGIAEPRILSFGCSNGAEVRALRSRLPQAWITGVDANRMNIALARKADRHPRSLYIHATVIAPEPQFDAVLAMAVFRRGTLEREQPNSCEAELPFTRFEEGVAMWDACLKPRGWLAIWNAQFRFADTQLASHYSIDPFRLSVEPQTLLYGPDNRRLSDASYSEILFRKA